ncbi:PREDICTED: protein lethal(2)denticleless-like [Ceratosolen solmsi marchali]|uniref:Protein lethal(2)denticleless-like n=1 Tax=Ceratosolen solmsi marchali TaxID=326594 RepID=A0AAJ6YKY6_9HYME|nr:PREDICTED: protein lethal(2)denticleless-like [Ceratosolen solmsi marchali]
MNIVRSITNREKGLNSIKDYDIALLRLKCYYEDVYKGIEPNTNAPDFNPEPPVFACRFSLAPGYEEVIALANEDGKIALQDTTIKQKYNKPLEGTQAHTDAIFDIAWMPQELKLITASGDHTARLWDVSSSGFQELQIFHAHTRSIKSAVFRHHDKAVFATGARDGAIMIWDTRASYSNRPKPDNSIYDAHNTKLPNKIRQRKTSSFIRRQNHIQSITGLAFQDDYTLLSCSTGDGLIKIWDLRKNYSIHKKEPIAKHIMNYGGKSNSNGFTSLLVCPNRITLYASCMDNIIYAYNISSYNSKPIAEYYGHKNSTFYVKACLSPDGKYLASGSSDELAYIWHTKRPGAPLLKLSGHREEVTCIAWCSLGESKIVTCSDDSCHRIWRIGREHINEDEKINICGNAEPIPQVLNYQIDVSTLEKTPTVIRSQTIPECSSESDLTPVTTTNSNLTDHSYKHFRSSKRCYVQIFNGYWSDGSYKFILSPVQETLETPAKRLNVENRGARRLFCTEMCSSSKGHVQSNNCYEFHESSSSSTNRDATLTAFSPTSNLPNFVVDGTAPHLLEMSPQKLKENIDWLTKIRKEKYSQHNCKTILKLSSPKQDTTPIHRINRSRSTEPRKTPNSPTYPLLQYFRPAIKDCNNDVCLESKNMASPCSSQTN